MEEKKIKTLKIQSKPQSVRNIQIFLGFTYFSKRLIRTISRLATLFILIFQIILKFLKIGFISFRADDNKYNKEIRSNSTTSKTGDIGNGNQNLSNHSKARKIKNLAKCKTLANSKKPDLIKSKISNLEKVKNSNFTKSNSFEIDFFILKAKRTFIDLQKIFINILILYYLDP